MVNTLSVTQPITSQSVNVWQAIPEILISIVVSRVKSHPDLSLFRYFLIFKSIFSFLTVDPNKNAKTDFPKPEMVVSCLSDGVQVDIHIAEQGFNGVLYVKGHSKDEECRRVITSPSDIMPGSELFKVQFGSCGLIHVNVSFIIT